MAESAAAEGPDFAQGMKLGELPREGTLPGRVGDASVLLSQFGGELFAVSGTCTHYGGSLPKGLFNGAEVRCPLHHACFNLKTGAVHRAPALDPLDRWKVEVEGDTVFVREKLPPAKSEGSSPAEVKNVMIVGGGAAGLSCANELRKLGYSGAIAILSADSDPPCDRPNLSKDYLAGTAPEEWIPLRGEDWYHDNKIDLRLNCRVRLIDTTERAVELESGDRLNFDRLLLATGSEPRHLNAPGFGDKRVLTLRTLADARELIDRAKAGARVVIIGSSFIGLEAAAALRKRGVEVDVVSPENVPFERVFGHELGGFIQKLHEDHGVRFHMGTVAASLEGNMVVLANGEHIQADFVLVGVGVVPNAGLADAAGLDTDNGVWVNEGLQTSCPGIFAAGDVAAYPHPRTGERVRIEHWAVAEQQGQIAAANMLGGNRRFGFAPFFWTEQYGVTIRYVGHAIDWDDVKIDGEISEDGCVLRYYREGKHLATASINRDGENLEDAVKLEGRA